MERAQEAITEQVDPEVLAALRVEATERLSELSSVITDLNEHFRLAGDRFRLPAIKVPQPEIDEDAARQALVAFDGDFVTATRALKARKAYGTGNGE